jgi:hypothetical protein
MCFRVAGRAFPSASQDVLSNHISICTFLFRHGFMVLASIQARAILRSSTLRKEFQR